jgi:hypothetical protein
MAPGSRGRRRIQYPRSLAANCRCQGRQASKVGADAAGSSVAVGMDVFMAFHGSVRLHARSRRRTSSHQILASSDAAPASARLTSTWRCRDTAGSALTGRHLPAAREHSHLFALSRVRVHLLSSAFARGLAQRATAGGLAEAAKLRRRTAWFQRGTGDS